MEDIIIKALYPYHLLRAEQITRLLYPTPKLGTLTTVQSRLTALKEHKYLNAVKKATKSGPRPFIYALGIKGKRYAEELGYEVMKYYQPQELEMLSLSLDHTLSLNDFLIVAENLNHYEPRISFSDLEHALIFEHKPLEYLEAGTGKLKTIKPDALFKLHVKRGGDKEEHYNCWTELDRGNVKDDPITKKYRAMLDYLQRGYLEQHMGKGPVRIFFVTTAGEKRLERLRMLFRQEFPSLNPRGTTNQLFKFCCMPPLMEEKPLPKTVFCAPYWATGYGDPMERQAMGV